MGEAAGERTPKLRVSCCALLEKGEREGEEKRAGGSAEKLQRDGKVRGKGKKRSEGRGGSNH